MALKIDVYLSEQCGSYYELRDNLGQARAAVAVPAEVEYHTLYYDDAVILNILGSPSIWINGRDAFPGGNAPGVT